MPPIKSSRRRPPRNSPAPPESVRYSLLQISTGAIVSVISTGTLRTPLGKAVAESPSSLGRAPVPPELEAAIKESRASEDIETRAKAFATVQRLVMENAFVAPLAFQFELVAMNKKVQGYKPNLLGKPKYDDVWLES